MNEPAHSGAKIPTPMHRANCDMMSLVSKEVQLHPKRSGRSSLFLLTATLAIFAISFGAQRSARASFFDSSPGKLARAHAYIDGPSNCAKCHVPGKRDVDPQKCLECHDVVAKRISDKRGIHASSKALNRPCELCHKEHKGPDLDMFGWQTFGGQSKFKDQHDISGFSLSGRHSVVDCDKCHKQKTATGRPSFLLASMSCQGCHKSPHGELHDNLAGCDRCHDAKSWRPLEPMKFDHNQDSRFPIESKHIGVPCNSCHPKSMFRLSNWSSDCTPCHKNVHGESLFGQKRCNSCHSARTEWTNIDFDHNHKTRFALEGPHRKPCATCHPPTARTSPSRQCDACHKDVHNGRFAKVGECATCHLSTTWGPELRFDHAHSTRFALTGRHEVIDCRACHRGKTESEYENFDELVSVVGTGKTKQVKIACMGCHTHENVHKKQFTNDQCLKCHARSGDVNQTADPKAFAERVKIGHGPGKPFQLVDGHRISDCRKCHKNDNYRDMPKNCGSCHEDRLHKGSLGKDTCLNCHEGARWAATKFDHDKTNYPLLGKHKEAQCESCHPSRQYKPTPTSCGDGACHLKDDAHERSLGTKCEQCHNPTGQLTFDHNDPKVPNRWHLDGKHQLVRCIGCHPDQKYKPAPVLCQGCHADPDAHKGELGLRCIGCHEPAGWKTIHTGHDIFPVRFGGAHDRLRCQECHTEGRLLQGMAQMCIVCHQRDDIHHNALGPRCSDCHTQQTFAAARFNHDRVGCTLIGIHRVLPCEDCHKGGNYMGLSPTCVSCHRDDAMRAAALANTGVAHEAQMRCGTCHNTTSFKPSFPGGTESICR
jgi:hypothetical protein